MQRQFSFDDPDDEDDDFMQYYRKYRPYCHHPSPAAAFRYHNSYSTSSLLGGSGSQASSSSPIPQLSLRRSESGSNSLASSTNSGRSSKKSRTSSIKRWFSHRRRPPPVPVKSRSMEEPSYDANHPFTHGKFSMAQNNPRDRDQQLSPISGLSGMLTEKMTFSSSTSTTTSNGHGDDSQSRDSGHSSGGSPDLRGLRKRRSTPAAAAGHLMRRPVSTLVTSEGYNNHAAWNSHAPAAAAASSFRDPWFRHTASSSIRDDATSMHSYATALDSEYQHVGQSEVTLQNSNHSQWDAQSVFSSAAGTLSVYNGSAIISPMSEAATVVGADDELNETPKRLERWSPQDLQAAALPDQRAKFAIGDDWQQDDQQQEDKKSVRSDKSKSSTISQSSRGKAPSHVPPRSGFSSFLSQVCRIFKTVLMTVSFLLLITGALFTWRSFRCESDRKAELDIQALESSLRNNLFGQTLARQEIIHHLKLFTSGAATSSVLVLVFTGWLGGGKTFTTSIIKDIFPVKENVHSFSVPLHFAKDPDQRFKSYLDDLAIHIGRACGYSLVIFDDIDSGSPKAIAQIEQFILNLRGSHMSSRSNGTLVLITSNAGGNILNNHVLQLLSSQVDSGESPESLLSTVDYATASSLVQGSHIPCTSHLSSGGVVSQIVPFLPLTRSTVAQCAKREAEALGVPPKGIDDTINTILNELGWFTDPYDGTTPLLAKTGCKQVARRVGHHLVDGHDDSFFGPDDSTEREMS